MVSFPHKVWGEFFSKKAFHGGGGGDFLDKFMGDKSKKLFNGVLMETWGVGLTWGQAY